MYKMLCYADSDSQGSLLEDPQGIGVGEFLFPHTQETRLKIDMYAHV